MIKEIKSFFCMVLIAFTIVLLINTFLLRVFTVSGASMENTLYHGNTIIGSKIHHVFKTMPKYGKIVVIDSRIDKPRTLLNDFAEVFQYNMITAKMGKTEHRFWVKRVIGIEGDTIEIKNGEVYRNGIKLEEDYIKEPIKTDLNIKVTVPKGHVFVMGDNRNNSADSRHIGPIPISHVVGEYLFKLN